MDSNGTGTLTVTGKSERQLRVKKADVDAIRMALEASDFLTLAADYGNPRQRNHPDRRTIRVETETSVSEVTFISKKVRARSDS